MSLQIDITLRKYQLSDVESFMEWACDPKVLQYSRLQGVLNHNSSREDIASYLSQVAIPHPWYRAICFDSRPVGFISIEPQGTSDVHRCRALLSYALGREYWGRGIATLAIRRAVLDAFREMPQLVRIEAWVDPQNKAFERVLQKVGFLKEGLLRSYIVTIKGEVLDLFVYSILASHALTVD